METLVSGKPNLIGRIIFPWVKKKRNSVALKRIVKEGIILDIGGGDGYLLENCCCKEGISIDGLKTFTLNDGVIREDPGQMIKNKLQFKNGYFDYVTMIAMIEHLEYPESIIPEIRRILKPDGLLIITTPKSIANKIIPKYLKGWNSDEHKENFNLETMEKLIAGRLKLQEYRTFELGINQLFVYRK